MKYIPSSLAYYKACGMTVLLTSKGVLLSILIRSSITKIINICAAFWDPQKHSDENRGTVFIRNVGKLK